MAEKRMTYEADYAVPPGWILDEMLETYEISHAEFARRCGRSPKLMSEIIAGKAPVEPETAIQFERVLGMDASVWLNLEANYRLHQAKEAETAGLEKAAEWAKKFPVKALIDFGAFEKPRNDVELVQKLLTFFGVAGVEAWKRRYAGAAISYRHSPAFESSQEAVTTWLRLGELQADQHDCQGYDRRKFLEALEEIRTLTILRIEEFLPRLRTLCNESGVAFVLVPSLPKTALSGAARWLTPRKALIQQSLRFRSNDHFWFTFFHESAHIVLHSKKDVFVDERARDGNELEDQANAWAANLLVPRHDWEQFVALTPRSEVAVRAFAKKQGIAPGIIVGMLQHRGILPWKNLNRLKQRYKWNHE